MLEFAEPIEIVTQLLLTSNLILEKDKITHKFFSLLFPNSSSAAYITAKASLN